MLNVITVLPLDAPQRQNAIGSGFDIFIGSSVCADNLMVFDTFSRSFRIFRRSYIQSATLITTAATTTTTTTTTAAAITGFYHRVSK
jgi:hypothetical protein